MRQAKPKEIQLAISATRAFKLGRRRFNVLENLFETQRRMNCRQMEMRPFRLVRPDR